MSIWGEIRRQAQSKHLELAGSGELVAATSLFSAAKVATGVSYISCPPGDSLLDGADAVYIGELRQIRYSEATEKRLAAFHIAHEYAHHWLDESIAKCSGHDLETLTPAEPEISLVGDPDAYSPKERAEAQANLFAREFLLPRDKLRARCKIHGVDADSIAQDVGVPVELVMQQLADALLLPPDIESSEPAKPELPPDDTQRSAITAGPGPRLVRAGPGTGKTRTLVGRIDFLVQGGTPPSSILALTFSNAAAVDLAARIKRALGEPATAIWTGTFHAYGLELLRKYGHAIGIDGAPHLLDRTASLLVLEQLLPKLRLEHYLNLVDPLLSLRAVYAEISYAKDYLVSPSRYAELGQIQSRNARDDDERLAAKKVLEVAEIYGHYEQATRAAGQVDFGDLIVRPIQLLQENHDIRDALRAERPHVLVDEYQDMNRASGLMLKELVTPNLGPWVVGDVRQSIYRFRGASPLNMENFDQDFPGAEVTDLGVNYRSGDRIVKAFDTFGRSMAKGRFPLANPLRAHKGDAAGSISYHVASSATAEFEGIAQIVSTDVANGGSYNQHVVLARSHTTLARLAEHFERAGVPCLYFGDFFQRPEVRDLLSMMSAACEWVGVGLFRAAQLSQFAVPKDGIVTVFKWRRDQGLSMLNALGRLDEISGLSDSARAALRALALKLRKTAYKESPHSFLLSFLFRDGGAHLGSLLADDTVAGQQRRLAIYQLLQFAFGFRAGPKEDPKRAFLEHVRRLEALDEDKDLRKLPAAASGIDAVRMMTVHASKGLQFPKVHIPSLTNRHFPINMPERRTPPVGMVDSGQLMEKGAEEESLFFVAMSRAQDELHLSRGLFHGGGGWRNLGPSSFLSVISSHLSAAVDAAPTWNNEGVKAAAHPLLESPAARESWPAWLVETYEQCPRRFYYEGVQSLGGREAPGPYLQFQSALHSSIKWMRGAGAHSERESGLSNQLSSDWQQSGLSGHPFEGIYRAAAERMLGTALGLMSGTTLPTDLSLTVGGGVVIGCSADLITSSSSGIVIRRLKTSRLSSKEKPKARYAVMQQALQATYPGASLRFEHVSLETGETRDATLDNRKLNAELMKLKEIFAGIQAGKFDPRPSDFNCPRCPYFFICPSHGAIRA